MTDVSNMAPTSGPSPWRAVLAVSVVSAAACALILWLVYGKEASGSTAAWVGNLPAVNAGLNATSALCMVLAVLAIKRGDRERHKAWMLGAVGASTLFLVGYLIYHWLHGETLFQGQGAIRVVYFFILISHIILSAFTLPMVLLTLLWAGTSQFQRHRRLAKWTFPIWLYVSVTGVLVFVLLNQFG